MHFVNVIFWLFCYFIKFKFFPLYCCKWHGFFFLLFYAICTWIYYSCFFCHTMPSTYLYLLGYFILNILLNLGYPLEYHLQYHLEYIVYICSWLSGWIFSWVYALYSSLKYPLIQSQTFFENEIRKTIQSVRFVRTPEAQEKSTGMCRHYLLLVVVFNWRRTAAYALGPTPV